MPTEWPGITIDQFLIDGAAELVRTVPAHSRRLRETVIEGERLKLLQWTLQNKSGKNERKEMDLGLHMFILVLTISNHKP